jgi:hypothetical protein
MVKVRPQRSDQNGPSGRMAFTRMDDWKTADDPIRGHRIRRECSDEPWEDVV